jgi:hypothetical protein
MLRTSLFALLGLTLLGALPRAASAQTADWRPPSRAMPTMPRAAELQGDWLSARSAWFQGVDGVTGVPVAQLRASGEPRGGSGFVQLVRFTSGPIPVVVWSDRNGDSRCDMIELLRRGGVIIQLIDADYDGVANVLRVYDARGELVRQDRM